MTFLKKSWAEELLASTIWEFVKPAVGAASVGAAAWLYTQGGPRVSSFVQKHVTGLALFLAVFGSAILVRSYYAWKYHSALPKQQHDFEQLARIISFEYRDLTHCIYRKAFKLRALRAGLSSYEDKYKWTGVSSPVIHSAVKEQTVRLTHQKSVWQFYQVEFERALNKGDIVDIDLVFTIYEPEHSFVPFISTTIEEPTKQLSFKLTIPSSFGITYATREIASCIGARVPFRTERVQFDTNGHLEWDIPKPKIHHYYELRWATPKEFQYDKASSGASTTRDIFKDNTPQV